ncbi:MAG: 16S rRNA (guanine(966)-N(2))-methyltransferase RsmD [Desulfobacterota bacterium]|nr:16S rRNA (guanine(966)-N(2))-methyltransferase RsmD [Thermodesulfobacteriota bacterium]
MTPTTEKIPSMRVISGSSKGRRLVAPRGQGLRPTSDRVKECLFNLIGEVEGRVVLDLFAGTGSLGIEALSRGAKRAVFVERAREALRRMKQNLSQCGMEDRAEILPKEVGRAIGLLGRRGETFDLILMDPPYEEGWIRHTFEKLKRHPIHRSGALLVIEHSRREPLPEETGGWGLLKQREVGDTVISILRKQGGPSDGTEEERR